MLILGRVLGDCVAFLHEALPFGGEYSFEFRKLGHGRMKHREDGLHGQKFADITGHKAEKAQPFAGPRLGV